MENLLKKSNGKWQEIYKCSELQRRGNLKYKGQDYCAQEYYAMRLCESKYINKFLSIEPEKRTSYKVDNHFGQADIRSRHKAKNKKMNYNEKLLARAMYNHYQQPSFGKFINYEVPLKASLDKNKKDGDIDLISQKGDTIYLVELKRGFAKYKKGRDETLLRALLEICTYYKRLYMENFKSSYNFKNIELIILVEKDSYAYKQADELKETSNLYSLFQKLANNLNVKISIYFFEITPQIIYEDAFDYDKNNLIASKITFKEGTTVEYKKMSEFVVSS